MGESILEETIKGIRILTSNLTSRVLLQLKKILHFGGENKKKKMASSFGK